MAQVDSFSGIVIFVTAARSRSFTDAAEQLGLTKSAVGKAIAKLEGALGRSVIPPYNPKHFAHSRWRSVLRRVCLSA
jgi:hypothetical protein